MANTKRRIVDRSGNMFVPMNMEGNNYTDSFWQTPKLIIGGTMLFILLAILLQPFVGTVQFGTMLKYFLMWAFVMFFVLRYIIFEEKFNYKMYKQMLQYEIQTPAIFWDIVQIKNTSDGAILTYRDGKTAVLLKIDRDTITGKPREFKETHFDAIQDFYNRLQNYKFSFVQMNIMEPAGNDPRLVELDKLVTKNDNPNIQKLMQLQVGYTKTITKKTLYESDLFLIYVKDRTRVDTIINDVEDCVFELLNGAYIGYRILDEDDILDFVKDQYGVSYFNRTEATLALFSRTNSNTKPTFSIVKVTDQSDREYNIQKEQFNRIHRMQIEAEKHIIDKQTINIKKDVIDKDPLYRNMVTFSDLAGDNKQLKFKDQQDEEQRFHMRKDIQKREPQRERIVLGKNIGDIQMQNELSETKKNTDKVNEQQSNMLKKDNKKLLNDMVLDFDMTDKVETVDEEYGDTVDANWDSVYNDNSSIISDEELRF